MRFPNLASHNRDDETQARTENIIKTELARAGIYKPDQKRESINTISGLRDLRDTEKGNYSEVPSRIGGEMKFWRTVSSGEGKNWKIERDGCVLELEFRRKWTYWVAEGPLPRVLAKILFTDHIGCTDIRAFGHAGRVNPDEYAPGDRPIDIYHIDSELGLYVFTKALNDFYLPRVG